MRVTPTVLLVEDEVKMREVLSRAIGGWGFEVSAAATGEEALRLMQQQPRNIILLDLNLPGMGGIEVLENIRQRWPTTAVIILTGFGDLDSAKKAIHLDVVEFLTKPAHLGELEAAIDRARQRVEDATPIEAAASPHATPPPTQSAPTLDDVERRHILAALARNSGNRAATAAELGISLRTLYYRLNEYQRQGIEFDQ